ncbi:glycerol-3-phosphate dehydrogenase/oxidase, partial [Iamia sp.]|uniref:glycerol-3-phosphate dehydrogenase/oxidase n=1 Tax=Iamia sp. TaxID=2722710 RepID=UPI002C6AF9B3
MIGPGWFDRADALRRLADDGVDVLVVGGGVTGAGCALDAASRGLRTGLIERDDFASGTSSKSSKLVHGGLRYLQQGEVRLVYEALHERQRLLRNAPHLVSVLPFLIPMFTGKGGMLNSKLSRALGSAMWAYDLTGGLRIGKRHERISAEEAVAHMPTLRADRLAASYLYYDAQADDARLTLALARTAAIDHGAAVANGARLVGLDKDATGRVTAARVNADGRELTIRCRAVVNAGGVWADDVRALDEGTHPDSIRPAKGVHITVPWDLVRNDIAAVVPVPGDKRSVFVVPWGDLTYIGTTDTDYSGPIDDAHCTAADVAYLLKAINGAITGTITEADVVGTWAGLRPLVKSVTSGRTADLSRRHQVAPSPSGVVSVTGGKLTTYREMAADAIDAVVATLPGDQP